MLELRNQRSLSIELPGSRPRGLIKPKEGDVLDFERLVDAPAVQLLPRDAFVAEVSIKLDRLNSDLKTLSRDIELIRGDVAVLREDAQATQRLAGFQEKEQRLKAVRLEDVQRRVQALSARVDAIATRPDGDFHAYNSFEAVSRKLTELSEIERSYRKVERKLEIATWLFCGSVLGWLFIVMA